MKRILISFILAAVVFPAAAQDFKGLFDEFAKTAEGDFSQFRKDADKSFADLMHEAWKEFEVSDALERPRKPEPETLPEAPKDSIPSGVALPEPVCPSDSVCVVTLPEEVVKPVVSPVEVPVDVPVEAPVAGKAIRFNFYNSMVEVTIPEGVSDFYMRNTSADEIRICWKELEKASFDVLLSQISMYEDKFALSGWSRYLMIDALTDVVYGMLGRPEGEVLKTYLLNRMGLAAKLASVDGRLTTLVAVREQVYSRVFVQMGDVKYYLEPGYEDVKELYSYDVEMSDGLKPVSVVIDRPLNFPGENLREDAVQLVERPSAVLGTVLSLPVNVNICKCYLDFPQVDADVYARSAVDTSFSEALLQAFKPYLEGKTEEEKVALLLKYMHFDFQYATDDDQFGYEKPFFLEEDFVYSHNDCEDRSILFAYLVRNLLGLDVVLLDYPDHIATAVAFSTEVQGDYFTYGQKRYVVCDPTYIGAAVGMTMQRYVNTEFKVLSLN